jgi:hypothetical protein
MPRLCILLGLFTMLLLAGCNNGPQPTPTGVSGLIPGGQPTTAPLAPTAVVENTSNIIDIATPSGSFVIPAAQPTSPSKPVKLQIEQSGIAPASGVPDLSKELAAFFKAFYDARTLTQDKYFDFDMVRDLTDEPYRDYTVVLLQKDAAEADAGRLLEVTYSDISIKTEKWEPSSNGKGTATVSVTRAKHETRKDTSAKTYNDTIRFKLERRPLSDGVSWVAVDIFDSTSNKWVSELVPPPSQDIEKEIADFFVQFYAARTLKPGGKFDIDTVQGQTAFAYQEYTIPLLQRQQEEADSGKLTSVTYSDIKTEVISWFPQATSHGGIATVKVTRTVKVVRPAGAERPKTETFQFRLHRHWGEDDKGVWLAVDFFSPATGNWVSESAGMTSPVPSTGHG